MYTVQTNIASIGTIVTSKLKYNENGIVIKCKRGGKTFFPYTSIEFISK